MSETTSIKSEYVVKEITFAEAKFLVSKYHYLSEKTFMFKKAYGLFHIKSSELVGASVFSTCTGIVTLKNWFGLDNSTTDILELIRLVVSPTHNGANFTSFLLGRSLRLLRLEKIRGVISLADSSRHSGGIYRACNFKYYGVTDSKTDFYSEDGRLNPRGKTSDIRGVWLPRSRKHRYFFSMKGGFFPVLPETKFSTCDTEVVECCNGSKIVFDSRFIRYYACPKCCPSDKLVADPML